MTLKIKYSCMGNDCIHTHEEESDITIFTLARVLDQIEYHLHNLHGTQQLWIDGIELCPK